MTPSQSSDYYRELSQKGLQVLLWPLLPGKSKSFPQIWQQTPEFEDLVKLIYDQKYLENLSINGLYNPLPGNTDDLISCATLPKFSFLAV